MTLSAIFERSSFHDAAVAADGAQQLLLVDFTASWCAPCKAMEHAVWQNAEVMAWIRQNARAIQVDIDADPATAERFNIRSVPTVVAWKMGSEVDRVCGAKPPDEFIEWLKGVLRGETELDHLRAAAQGRKNLMATYAYARGLEMANKLDQATEEYLWMWNHGADAEPEWSAVKYSFLVADLVRLVTSHPPAAEALRPLRDAARVKVEGGSFEGALQDWIALNQMLGESTHTLAWFDGIKHHLPPGLEPERLQYLLKDLLVAHHRWADLGRLIVRPLKQLRQHIKALRAEASQVLPPELSSMGEEMGRERLRLFHRELAQLYAALAAAGRNAEARELFDEAQRQDPTQGLVDAFEEALRQSRNAAGG